MTEIFDDRVTVLREISQFKRLSEKRVDSKVLTQLGFTDFTDHDEMFYLTTLPSGWIVKQDGRNPYLYWFRDELGRNRLHQIYKGAVYGHQRSLHVQRRFAAQVVRESDQGSYSDYKVGESHVGIVVDSGMTGGKHIIWQSESLKLSKETPWVEHQKLQRLADKWLKSNYRQHEDPFAYWD